MSRRPSTRRVQFRCVYCGITFSRYFEEGTEPNLEPVCASHRDLMAIDLGYPPVLERAGP